MTPWTMGLIGSLLLTPVVVAAARRVHLVDVPNQRSSHVVPTPRGGGLAVAVASIVAVAVSGAYEPQTLLLVAGATLLGAIGLLDDWRSLPASTRLGVQAVVPLLTLVPAVEASATTRVVVAIPLVVVVAGFVNAFNFMDGINGISAMQAAVIAGALGVTCSELDAAPLAACGWAIAGACLGFLPFNAVRPRIFLGDVGSYFIGFWLAGLAVLAVDSGASGLRVAAPFLLYVADTGFVLVQRTRRGESLMTAHREHTYQRLVTRGWPHVVVAVLCATISAACAFLMWIVRDSGDVAQLSMFVLCVVLVCGYLALPAVLDRRSAKAT